MKKDKFFISNLILLSILFVIIGIVIHKKNVFFIKEIKQKYEYLKLLSNPVVDEDGRSLIGKTFYDFSLRDFQGNLYNLNLINSLFKLIIIFDIEDCNTCLNEYILWSKLYEIYPPDKLSVLGICISREKESILNFISDRNIKFLILWDPERKVTNSMRFRTSPLRILLNQNNEIIDIERTQTTIIHQKYILNMIDQLILREEDNINKRR